MKKILVTLLMMANIAVAATITPIEVVVPTAPGGPTDTLARTIGKMLNDHGYETFITFYPGNGGLIAYNHTINKGNNAILIASLANTVYPNIQNRKDPLHALNMKMFDARIGTLGIFLTPVDSKFANFNQLIDVAKKEEVPCGTSATHAEVELQIINKKYGTKFIAVPFNGTAPLQLSLMGGHVACGLDTSQLPIYESRSNKIRILAISSSQTFGNIQLVNSLWPGYEFENFWVAMVPKSSNLLEDEKIVHMLNTWTSDSEIIKPLITQGFLVKKSIPNMNKYILDLNKYYADLFN